MHNKPYEELKKIVRERNIKNTKFLSFIHLFKTLMDDDFLITLPS